jgi:hypothetical protein
LKAGRQTPPFYASRITSIWLKFRKKSEYSTRVQRFGVIGAFDPPLASRERQASHHESLKPMKDAM